MPPSAAPGSVAPGPTAAPVDGFTTRPIGGIDATWTGLRWRHVDEGDPVGLVRSVGPPPPDAAGATSPLWRSADGRSWDPVSLGVPGTGVVGAAQVGDTLVVVTMHVVGTRCVQPALNCSDLTGPLRIWSSDDGLTWTERPSPIEMAPQAGIDGYDAPSLVAGSPSFLFVTDGERRQVAASMDGIQWSVVALADPSGGPPFRAHNLGRLGSSVIAVGESETDGEVKAVAWSSTDGARWEATTLPVDDAPTGAVAGTLEMGAAGVLAMGSTAGDGGPALWWASDGSGWTLLDDFPPLGAWVGDGAGSGGVADGFVVGDGRGLIAYHGGDDPAAWRSTDALDWTPVSVEGGAPEVGNGGYTVGTFALSPLGLLFLADDGEIWLAEPLTD